MPATGRVASTDEQPIPQSAFDPQPDEKTMYFHARVFEMMDNVRDTILNEWASIRDEQFRNDPVHGWQWSGDGGLSWVNHDDVDCEGIQRIRGNLINEIVNYLNDRCGASIPFDVGWYRAQ